MIPERTLSGISNPPRNLQKGAVDVERPRAARNPATGTRLVGAQKVSADRRCPGALSTYRTKHYAYRVILGKRFETQGLRVLSIDNERHLG